MQTTSTDLNCKSQTLLLLDSHQSNTSIKSIKNILRVFLHWNRKQRSCVTSQQVARGKEGHLLRETEFWKRRDVQSWQCRGNTTGHSSSSSSSPTGTDFCSRQVSPSPPGSRQPTTLTFNHLWQGGLAGGPPGGQPSLYKTIKLWGKPVTGRCSDVRLVKRC